MFFPLKEWKRRRSRDEGKKEYEEEKQGKEVVVVEEVCGCLWGVEKTHTNEMIIMMVMIILIITKTRHRNTDKLIFTSKEKCTIKELEWRYRKREA